MLKGLTQHGPHALVGDVMQRQFETAGPFEMLESAFARLQTCGCRSLPVLRGGRLVGVVTMDNVSELLMVQAALRSGRPLKPSSGRLFSLPPPALMSQKGDATSPYFTGSGWVSVKSRRDSEGIWDPLAAGGSLHRCAGASAAVPPTTLAVRLPRDPLATSA